MAEPAPTRRSTRLSTEHAAATPETPGLTRAELRRRAARALADASAATDSAPAAPEAACDTHTVEAASLAVVAALVAGPARAAADAAPVDAPVDDVEVEVAPLTAPTPAPAAMPTSRRARRAATAAQPAVLPDPVVAPVEPFELLEPALTDAAERTDAAAPPAADDASAAASDVDAADVDAADGPADPIADAFEEAARLFSFTGETPVQTEAQPEPEDATPPVVSASHAVARGRRVSTGEAFKRVTAVSFSVGVMGIVGLLTVGMTTPAEAVAAAGKAENPVAVLAEATGAAEVTVPESEIQAYVAPEGTENPTIDRPETYSTMTMAELASESGIQNTSNFFVNDPNSAIQWPFAVGVPISYGFGMRSGQMHEGVDFTPGDGAPIQAIADGVVRVATEAGGAYGVHVIIDHEVDGQLVSSHYAHLQYGSIQVVPGQQVTVGTILGRTGNTGRSYGAHTHFEILMGGATAIDPIPWLRQHAGG